LHARFLKREFSLIIRWWAVLEEVAAFVLIAFVVKKLFAKD